MVRIVNMMVTKMVWTDAGMVRTDNGMVRIVTKMVRIVIRIRRIRWVYRMTRIVTRIFRMVERIVRIVNKMVKIVTRIVRIVTSMVKRHSNCIQETLDNIIRRFLSISETFRIHSGHIQKTSNLHSDINETFIFHHEINNSCPMHHRARPVQAPWMPCAHSVYSRARLVQGPCTGHAGPVPHALLAHAL